MYSSHMPSNASSILPVRWQTISSAVGVKICNKQQQSIVRGSQGYSHHAGLLQGRFAAAVLLSSCATLRVAAVDASPPHVQRIQEFVQNPGLASCLSSSHPSSVCASVLKEVILREVPTQLRAPAAEGGPLGA